MQCRICLTDVTPLIGIFSEDGMNHQLADKIRICLQLQVQKEDCFPDTVCCKCFMSVNEFFSFLKKARESYKLLQKLQKDITLKQSVSWPCSDTENEDVIIEPTPDLLDMIDMETTTGERQIADTLKQPGSFDYMSNITGKRESTFSLLPTDINYKEKFPSNMSRREMILSRYLENYDAVHYEEKLPSNMSRREELLSRYLDNNADHYKPTMHPTHDTKTWKYISEEHPAQQKPQTRTNDHHLDSKPNQFISKQFSFGRPSMTYDVSKEVQDNSTNSWETFRAEKPDSKLHIAEKEMKHENLSNSFSFSMKCSRNCCNSEVANSPLEHKAHNPGSQSLFSSNDEHSLPNIPLSLFSSSDDKKQTSLESKNTENLLNQSPIIGASKVNSFSQKPNDTDMTPRSKVMKMLNREMW